MTRQELIIQNTKLQNECQRLLKCGQAAAEMNAVYCNFIKQLVQLTNGCQTLPYKKVDGELVISDDPTAKVITLSVKE